MHKNWTGALGGVFLFLGISALLVLGNGGGTKAEAAGTDPVATLLGPADGGTGGAVVCPPPKFAAVKIGSGHRDQRTVIIQNRDSTAIRLGPSTVKGGSATKNGIRLAQGQSVNWNIGSDGVYCVAEDAATDAGSVADTVFGVGGAH